MAQSATNHTLPSNSPMAKWNFANLDLLREPTSENSPSTLILTLDARDKRIALLGKSFSMIAVSTESG